MIKSFLDGTREWYQNGKLHRTDGPAVERANGDKIWYQNGYPHRIDGPAIECANGDKEWWQNGKLHRTDGPAIEYANGNKVWQRSGIYIKSCYPKTFSYVKNKGTENEEEMEIELCCKECAKLYHNLSEKEFKAALDERRAISYNEEK